MKAEIIDRKWVVEWFDERQCYHITGNEEPEYIDAGQDPDHGQAVGDGNSGRKADAHGLFAHCAGAHLLDLLVKDMYGGLGADDEPAHDHCDRHQQPFDFAGCYFTAEQGAER